VKLHEREPLDGGEGSRLAVPGGWLYSYWTGNTWASGFVPDEHADHVVLARRIRTLGGFAPGESVILADDKVTGEVPCTVATMEQLRAAGNVKKLPLVPVVINGGIAWVAHEKVRRPSDEPPPMPGGMAAQSPPAGLGVATIDTPGEPTQLRRPAMKDAVRTVAHFALLCACLIVGYISGRSERPASVSPPPPVKVSPAAEPAANAPRLYAVGEFGSGATLYSCPVPGGTIYVTREGKAMTFVPDPKEGK